MKAIFDQGLWNKILEIDLSRVFSRLVHKLKFDPQRATGAITDYRRYLYLINTVGNITPSEDVDEAWHAHVLHLPSYVRDCMLAFDKIIWHIPKPISEGKAICSGDCNVGECNPNCRGGLTSTKPGYLTFTIDVPIDEYANADSKKELNFASVSQLHFT